MSKVWIHNMLTWQTLFTIYMTSTHLLGFIISYSNSSLFSHSISRANSPTFPALTTNTNKNLNFSSFPNYKSQKTLLLSTKLNYLKTMKMHLSTLASTNSHGQDSSYFLGWEEYEKNPYLESDNPDGMIQMGLAENQLCFDLLESWLTNNPEPASFTHNGQSVFRHLALFQDYHGLPEFKKVSIYNSIKNIS